MSEQRFTIQVTQIVEVSLDPTKFTECFMSEFRASFYPFQTVQDHAEHIAQLEARGIVDLSIAPKFIEGYGPSEAMGLSAKVIDTEVEVVSE